MNLLKFIQPECILTGVKASGVEDLLEQQAATIHAQLPEQICTETSLDDLVARLLEREEKQSTGLGNGILVPHARVNDFSQLGLSIAVLEEPMSYKCLDDKPIQLSCMVIAPAETPNIVIKIWSTLARLLNDPAVHEYFLNAKDPETIFNYLKSHDLNLKLSVTASDIMVKPRATLTMDTSIQDTTHLMYKHKEATLAVLDEKGVFLGQVTADNVFHYGMPEFFTQLQSVSFVRNFNPLDKYFQNEGDMTATALLDKDAPTLPTTATLIEVIFQLSVKKHLKVFVTDPKGKLVGIIDRLAVLDRAINF
ncbi:PTS sugar transporter subunit IIA [Kiritimatiellaeota bacterium B1221]|nr:PTS sugar transporter subunit IIA [Kiritimatiellaeota bacterium B1221]